MRFPPGTACGFLLVFFIGFFTHLLYQRWNPPEPQQPIVGVDDPLTSRQSESMVHPVSFVPLAPSAQESTVEPPLLAAREVEKIRAIAGQRARIRGRVFRVGHAVKSNTYFLSFGPSREALTAVIFSSAAELFDKNKTTPKNFENREVEITGFIKDHPQYGLELVLEDPKQIRIID
jgi:hypothetical protein